jgi:hypothetical protein
VPCDAPAAQCFAWHIRPKLRKPVDAQEGYGARALCPAHDDHERSLSISVGDSARITWQCFACRNRQRVRLALIRECGIDAGCLPLVRAEKEELLDYLAELLAADTASHAEIRLRAMAAIEGYRELPRGKELERVAALTSVSRSEAYEYRKRGSPVQTANPCSYPSGSEVVKPRRSASTQKVR